MPAVAQLAVLSGSDVSYVGQASAPRAPTTVARLGVRLPAHLTATGRAMLAALASARPSEYPPSFSPWPHERPLPHRGDGGPPA